MTQPTQISTQLLFLSFHTCCLFHVRPVQLRRQICLCCIPSDRSCGLQTIRKSLACVLSEYTDRHNTCTSTFHLSPRLLVAQLSATLVFPRIVHRAFASWLGLQSLIRSRIGVWTATISEHQKTTYQLLVIVLGTVVQVFSSDSLRSRSWAGG